MHGITRTRKLPGQASDRDEGIGRITVRYTDGRVINFIPEAAREVFDEDDMLEVKKIFTQASSTSEWAEVGDIAGAGG